MDEYTKNGIMFTWELISSQGGGYILYPTSENTQDQVEAAKAELRDTQDVVWIRVASEGDRDNLYKHRIFAVPTTSHLKWYEVNQSPELIRQERLAGTTPEEFVDRWVLPFVDQTKAANEERFGSAMYDF